MSNFLKAEMTTLAIINATRVGLSHVYWYVIHKVVGRYLTRLRSNIKKIISCFMRKSSYNFLRFFTESKMSKIAYMLLLVAVLSTSCTDYIYKVNIKVTYTNGDIEYKHYNIRNLENIYLSNSGCLSYLYGHKGIGRESNTIACGVREFEIIKEEKYEL